MSSIRRAKKAGAVPRAAVAPDAPAPEIKFDLKQECCGSCHFYRSEMSPPIQGWCAKNPPQAFSGDEERAWSFFPPMHMVGWCGEYKRKEQVPE